MTARSYRWLRAPGFLAATLAGLLALGACSASENTGGAPAGGPAVDQADDRGNGGAAEAPLPAPTGGTGTSTDAPVQERSLIYTASLTVTTKDLVKAADDAIALATGVGAFVGADRRDLDADRSSATIVFRVPASKFTSTLDALAKLGTEESRQVETEDVTAAVIDLDARVATQQASVDRIRALLARAQTIAEIASIESELARREADLDSLKQRRARLAGLVALSTITLHLRGPAAPLLEEEEETGFLAGLESGWEAFLASVKIVMTVLGFLLPWIVAIGVPLWLLLWLIRRSGRKRPPAPPAPPGPVPAPMPNAPAPLPTAPQVK